MILNSIVTTPVDKTFTLSKLFILFSIVISYQVYMTIICCKNSEAYKQIKRLKEL